MAFFLRIALLVVLQQSLMGSFDVGDYDGMSAYSRNLNSGLDTRKTFKLEDLPVTGQGLTYKVHPFKSYKEMDEMDDCNPVQRYAKAMSAQFNLVKADNGQVWQGHIVKKEDQQCWNAGKWFGDKPNTSFKKCLEFATTKKAPSFHYDQTTRFCQLYKSWREQKLRDCRRGTEEKVYYLRTEQPANHKPCRGVTVTFKVAYTATGGVIINAKPKNDYCGCDIEKITLQYHDKVHDMVIIQEDPRYYYIYPETTGTPWLNYTTIRVYATGAMIFMSEWIPSADL